MQKTTIALCMIARNREQQIIRVLNSTQGVFDLYCLADNSDDNKTINAFKQWCIDNNKKYHIIQKKLGNDYKFVEVNGNRILAEFDTARNDSFAYAKRKKIDFAFWCDADDVVINPLVIRMYADKMKTNGINAALMTYIYHRGSGGLKPVVQKRERIIDLNVPGKWINHVHEVYDFEQTPKIVIIPENEAFVEHLRQAKEIMETGRRNHLIMKQQEDKEGLKSFSNNMLQSYAFDHWEHREYKDALRLYKILLKRKINEGEFKYQILIRMARAYLNLGKHNQATKYANQAINIINNWGDPYLILADVYTDLRRWDEVIYYSDKILSLQMPQTATPINEYDYLVTPRRLKINAFIQTNNIERAINEIDELMKVLPTEEVRKEKDMLLFNLLRQRVVLGLDHLVRYYQETNKMKYADRIKDVIPLDLLNETIVRKLVKEIMHDYRRKNIHFNLSGPKTIAIYAGEGVIEPWDGNSDLERGIGGSEGMTIQLSRELAKLGNKIIIYNDCGESAGKIFDGVKYQDYRKWQDNLKSDVFISLRRPDVFARLLKAKKQYLWLHDTYYGEYPKVLFNTPDKVFVLSQAHKDIIKSGYGITDDSIFHITRNGLNPLAIKYADKNAEKRNPYQVIYASSYDRGLDNVLESWAKIVKEVPQAQLKIFYGWNTFDKLMTARQGTPRGDEMKRYKSKLIELMAKSPNIQEIGKVSQNEVYKAFAESSIWYYPTEFYEISCINAMTAQALGCVPVCTPFAALNETVNSKYGLKVPLDNITDGLIYLLKNQNELEKKRKPMTNWARKQFDMAELALEWDNFFNTN